MGRTLLETGTGALRRRTLLRGVPLLALGPHALAGAQEAPSDIHLVSDAWHDLTRPDGSGLYFDLIRAVYARAGIRQVRIQILPYARSVGMVRDKRADAWVASFLDEQDFPLYPKWHFDRNAQVVLYRADAAGSFQGRESLRQQRVAWLRGFGLDRYIQVPMQVTEIDTIASAFGMLERKRIAFFVGARSDLQDHIRAAKVDMAPYRVEFLMHLGLYLAFADTARGAALRALWDQQMEVLHKDPSFLAIYKKYNYDAPFEA